MRIAYIVSRFPHVSETFIVRELDAVSATGEVEIELLSLFPAVAGTVHPAAEPWVRRLQRATVGGGLAALVWWLFRRPLRLASSAAVVVRAYARRPRLALRAIASVVIACRHARALAERPVDHVHAHYATYPALAAWLCWRLLGVGYSFTAHAHDLYLDQSMLGRKIADARFVVTISDFNRDWLRPFAGDSETPIEVVHCGIDLAEYEYRGRSLPAQGPVGALCVASLQEYKGHAVLLRALAADPRLGRVRVELVGEGKLRASLEHLAAELGIAHRVKFAGGLREAAVRDRLAAADLFVLPSIIASDGQMEGLPVVLIEAMASGVPVVATRLSGIPELVVDGETGLLAEPSEPADLARALARALDDDPGEVMHRVVAGRERVERGFDLRETGERMAALYAAAVRGVTELRAASRSAPRSPAS
jgi:colanic acid/amylovoran biosynthesis glycosyltransferase